MRYIQLLRLLGRPPRGNSPGQRAPPHTIPWGPQAGGAASEPHPPVGAGTDRKPRGGTWGTQDHPEPCCLAHKRTAHPGV